MPSTAGASAGGSVGVSRFCAMASRWRRTGADSKTRPSSLIRLGSEAVLWNYACHPVFMPQMNHVSAADFIGAQSASIAAARSWGPGRPCCSGKASPATLLIRRLPRRCLGLIAPGLKAPAVRHLGGVASRVAENVWSSPGRAERLAGHVERCLLANATSPRKRSPGRSDRSVPRVLSAICWPAEQAIGRSRPIAFSSGRTSTSWAYPRNALRRMAAFAATFCEAQISSASVASTASSATCQPHRWSTKGATKRPISSRTSRCRVDSATILSKSSRPGSSPRSATDRQIAKKSWLAEADSITMIEESPFTHFPVLREMGGGEGKADPSPGASAVSSILSRSTGRGG